MKTIDTPIVSFLMTGSELMSGDTIDSNSAWLAGELLNIGLAVNEMATVGDCRENLAEQIFRLSSKSHLLIINGGLGPTQDDLTAEVLASVAGTYIESHAQARLHIIEWCKKKGFNANSANLKQAELPHGCNIFPDAPGSAPAFYLTINDCLVIATPGVPSELKSITRTHLLTFLRQYFALATLINWKKIQLIGIGESRIQQIISEELHGINTAMDIGFRAGFPTLELKYKPVYPVTAINDEFRLWEQKLLNRIDDFVLGAGNFDLPMTLVNLLRQEGKTLATAESCTGGLIASEITKIPGASAVFPGGVVSYSNAMKEKILGVSALTLNNDGAVSKATVQMMLDGILELMDTDIGIAVSGIAGPDGGTVEKPVGTVWIAWGSHSAPLTICLHIPLERKQFQVLVSTIGLDLIRRWLSGDKKAPAYLTRWQS